MNGDKLLKHLESIITEIMALVMAADLRNDGSEVALLKKIFNILDQFGYTVEQVLSRELIAEYFGGVDAATAALLAAGESVDPTLAITKDGLIAKPFQSVIHLEAVENLIDDSMLDMSAAIEMAKESAFTTVTDTVEAVRSELVRGQIMGDPRKKITQQVMSAFLDRGLTSFRVEDKNGVIRNLPLDFYSMTVVRSKMRDAQVQGSKNRYLAAGQDLVIITGNLSSCEHCARFNGMVVSLTGKTPGFPVVGENGIKLPPYHPNCRCGHRVFIMRAATKAEIDKALAKNKAYKPTGDPRSPAHKAAYDREQEGRRKARAELKQFQRWQNGLGAEAPKTLAAFRRMKRQNTTKFQELQSAYRSWALTK